MPRLAPKELKLEAKEREHLEKLINRHTTEQQIGHWYRLARSYKRCNTRGSRNQANLE